MYVIDEFTWSKGDGDPPKDFCKQVFFKSTLSLLYKSVFLFIFFFFSFGANSLIFVKIIAETAWKISSDPIKTSLTFANKCILIIYNIFNHTQICLIPIHVWSNIYEILGHKRGFLKKWIRENWKNSPDPINMLLTFANKCTCNH
jgi:hypothetical protein